MKLFKFGVVLSSILIGVGVMGLGSSLGHLYNETNLEYTFEFNEELNVNALKEIYIDSDFEVRIEETTGTPRVEFETSMKGVSIPEPKYNLEVREEGEATYITMDKESDGMQFMISRDREELVIYLPKQVIEVMEVNGWGSLTYKGKNDIKELKIQGINTLELDLEGNYGEVLLSANSGYLAMNSLSPATVEVEGLREIDLQGQYSKIELESDANITINSSIPADLEIIEHRYNYNDQDIVLQGQFLDIDLEVSNRKIEFLPTIDTRMITIEGDYNDTKIVIPEGSKGFEIMYEHDEYEDSNIDFYSNLEVDTRPVGEDRERILYGEQAMSITVEGYENDLTVVQ